jgi:hypothetical protein
MISVLILICSISTPPQNCDSSSALATLRGGKTASVASCGVEAQVFLARSALKPDPAREYAKIECLRGERAQG